MSAANWIVGKPKEVKETAPVIVEIAFFAEDGKAKCIYTGPNTTQKGIVVEVKDQAHVIALVRRAVQRANEFQTTITLLHGPEIDGYAKFCLSDQTYAKCKTEIEKAEIKERGLWKASW